MLKEAIEKIVSLAENKTYEIGGQTYSEKRLERIPPHVDRPEQIAVSGLDGIVKLIRKEIERLDACLFVHILSHNKVNVFTTYQADYSRNSLYTATADVPSFANGYRGKQEALVELRSRFIENDGVKYLLDLLSRMTAENNVSTTDNGVTQTVEAIQGISLTTKLAVKPKVKLCPYRTFLEVEQPESEILLRIDDQGHIGLFEADGGMWKLAAKQSIADYFETSLADLIQHGSVVVMR